MKRKYAQMRCTLITVSKCLWWLLLSFQNASITHICCHEALKQKRVVPAALCKAPFQHEGYKGSIYGVNCLTANVLATELLSSPVKYSNNKGAKTQNFVY